MIRPVLLRSLLRRRIADRRGAAMLEFAIALPVCLIGLLGGSDVAWYIVTWQQVAILAATTADNASRIGEDTTAAPVVITESLINDLLEGSILQQNSLNIANRGKIIVSSLEENANGQQWIHWQRCIGGLNYGSTEGDPNSTSIAGMGNPPMTAPAGGALMYVEIAYDYKPIFSNFWYGSNNRIVEKVAFRAREQRTLADPTGASQVLADVAEDATPLGTCQAATASEPAGSGAGVGGTTVGAPAAAPVVSID
jgi:Flp pilus assembly protein TadG